VTLGPARGPSCRHGSSRRHAPESSARRTASCPAESPAATRGGSRIGRIRPQPFCSRKATISCSTAKLASQPSRSRGCCWWRSIRRLAAQHDSWRTPSTGRRHYRQHKGGGRDAVGFANVPSLNRTAVHVLPPIRALSPCCTDRRYRRSCIPPPQDDLPAAIAEEMGRPVVSDAAQA